MVQFNIEKIKNEIDRKFTDVTFIAPDVTEATVKFFGNRRRYYFGKSADVSLIIASGFISVMGNDKIYPADYNSNNGAIDKLKELMVYKMLYKA
jgi:hypothetical protein